ncbi:MAG: heparinase II/III family protein [Armatimonadetes bacterium]|nr:heparinase II/III family protein [Armatimonadota bacterium]
MVLALLAAGRVAVAEDFPEEWGAMWRPELPAVERHPCLFYDDSDRERMRARLEREPWSEWRAQIERYTPAIKWWLLGDENAAAQVRKTLIENPIWREPTHGYLEPSSHRFSNYVIAYDLLASWDGLSPEDHKIIRDKIAAEADYYYETMNAVPGGANYGNQRVLGASALGMAALVLCEYRGDPYGPKKWLERALHEIRREENWWFFRPGGLFVEGLGYTNYMNVQFVPFAIAYERVTGRYFFADERLREWLIFAAYQLRANGERVMWGTSESSVGLGYYGLLSNERYGRDLAPLFHRVFNLPSRPRLHAYHYHIALALYDPDVPDEPIPASRSFGSSQTVVLRRDWGRDTLAVWFAGKDGTWPIERRYGTYSHGDCGHFVLAYHDEVLATDSGYDHWKSRDYYSAEFHNVILIDGQGPAQDTPGEMSNVELEGPVRHATVTCEYQGCRVRRTLAMVRDRYVLVADHIEADAEHEYAWEVRSTCPPDAEGTLLDGREVTWPGLDATDWRSLKPGRTELTTVAPPFAELTLQPGRWRPMSGKDEFHNQVAVARWSGVSGTALFALIPNLRDDPAQDVSWRALDGQNLRIIGPDWEDRVTVAGELLTVTSSDGAVECELEL